MVTLPQLIEEDIQGLSAALKELVAKTEARMALVTDKAGFRLAEEGDCAEVDTTTLAALASNTFNATQAIATMLEEPEFNCVYQQGQKFSLLVQNVDEHSLLIVIFSAQVSAGMVKYYLAAASETIAARLKEAKERAPGQGLDLAMLNVADTESVFKRKT